MLKVQYFLYNVLLLFGASFAHSSNRSESLESLSPVQEFTVIKPESDNGRQKISAEFMASVNAPDTLDSFLNFLQESESPVSSLLDLRNLLEMQKEEKLQLENGLRQVGVEMEGIRYEININICILTYLYA